MADTLARLADEGPDCIRNGDFAARIAEEFAANNAFVTADDLSGYVPCCGNPITGSYRGLDIRSNPPPGSGIILIEMSRSSISISPLLVPVLPKPCT